MPTAMFASPTQAAVATCLLILGFSLYRTLYRKRFIENAHLPQLPPSLLWGHMLTFDSFTKRGVADRAVGQ